MCTKNLVEVGCELLGDNVSEERPWAHETKVSERSQIDEAVRYHMNNQHNLRKNRIEMWTKVKRKMKWEIEMKSMLKENKDKLYV